MKAGINEVEDHGPLRDGSYTTKQEAVAAGRDHAISTKTEHVIHNHDGTISERNSYGNDAATRPG